MNLSSLFRDLGNPEHLARLATATVKPSFSGIWGTVELQPDVFIPQRFSVGVIVQPEGKALKFKLLEDYKSFECVYGEAFPRRAFREIMTHVEETLHRAARHQTAMNAVTFGSATLQVSAPAYTSGDDVESTVDRLFQEVVVMAPKVKAARRGFASLDTSRVRALVNEELKRIAHLDYEKFVLGTESGSGEFVDDRGVQHFLDFNLKTGTACGSVVSAVHKNASTVEFNVLKSSRDLTTYSRIRNLKDTGLFLLLPDKQQLEAREYKSILDVIEEQAWKLKRDGFRVVSLPSETEFGSGNL
ncbi:hypothetical protein [Caballeronia sp. LZ032]|uniref:hypothetical protein n=1 Tax=Caballeronia sp. LZ032 TaxID=3038565 RepID=UPI00285B6C4C|nr:hypothetical protein [Caballeronia sp. LZ032]MDR5882021.1 hypothetical protein [Caballeronia sp. LZ032]